MSSEANFSCLAYVGGLDGRHIDLDHFRCFLTYFSIVLDKIQFGYICMVLLIIIMLVSIFGGIKEQYRWFILNQAFWDFAISYSFICSNWMSYVYYGTMTTTCFYDFSIGWLRDFFQYGIDTNSYSALLLFSFTRFLGLYYPQFYDKITKGRRILYLILIYNFFVIFTNIHTFFWNLYKQRKTYLKEECLKQVDLNGASIDPCSGDFDGDFLVTLYQILFSSFSCIMFLKPMLCLLISLISSVFIILRIRKLYEIQSKYKRSEVKNSIRVGVVIVLQTLINLFVFLAECVKNIPMFMGNTFSIIIMTSIGGWQCTGNCHYYILPNWLAGDYGVSSVPVLQAIIQFRIFIECLVILFIMTGYRESLFSFMKSPRKELCKMTNSEVTVVRISSFNNAKI